MIQVELIFTRIATALRWRRQGLDDGDVQVSFYRGVDEGDATDGHTTAVAVMRVEGMPEPNVSLHTTDASCAALRRVLADSEHIPWDESIRFESVHERCLPDLLAAIRAHGDPRPALLKTDKMLLPRDECLRLEVRPLYCDQVALIKEE
ncbi:hypothetical protein FOCC_FOCC010715 [Frankliniella occidentalis]|nr:hypothetical protein FOCC_FOCC010715 [Frankliniella occidentalis]